MTSGEMLSSYISATSSKATNNEISVRSKHVREWSMSMKSLASTLSCTQTTNKCNTWTQRSNKQINKQRNKETNTPRHVLKHPTPPDRQSRRPISSASKSQWVAAPSPQHNTRRRKWEIASCSAKHSLGGNSEQWGFLWFSHRNMLQVWVEKMMHCNYYQLLSVPISCYTSLQIAN